MYGVVYFPVSASSWPRGVGANQFSILVGFDLVGKEITKHIHQVKTSFMYSLLEKLSLLELKGSVIALSLR